MKILIKILIGLWIAVFVSGCSLLPSLNDSGQALEDTEWLLIVYRGKDALTEVKSTVTFQNGEVGGFGGCNQFGGQYDLLAGGGNRIVIQELVSTLMFCEAPQGVMDQEAAFLEILNDAERFEVANDRLKIFNTADEELIFKINE